MSDQPSSTTIFGADPEVVRRVSASAEAQEITERGLFLAQRLCDPDNDLSTPVIENLIQAMHHQRIEAQRLLLKAYMAREQQNEVEGRRLEQALWEDVQELQERVEESISTRRSALMSQYRQQDRALHALIDRLPIPLPWKTAAKKVLRDALALDHLSNGGLVSLIEEKQERSRNLLRMLIAAEKGVEQQRR